MLGLLGRPSHVLSRACTATSVSICAAQPVTATLATGRIQVRAYGRPSKKPDKECPPARFAYQKEDFFTPEHRQELDAELQRTSAFEGQSGVLYKAIVDELVAEHHRYLPRIAPVAISFLYSSCENVDQLSAVMRLHRRFRASSSDQGGGAHSISHNAVIACLRLDQTEAALDLLMNKYDYSVWPPAATYTILLDYMLGRFQEKPDLMTEVYEAAFTVMRDGVQLTPTLASLCVTALSIHDPNDAGAEDEATDPPAPYTQPNLPVWKEYEYQDHRNQPHWANQLETKHERLSAAIHIVKQQRSAGLKLMPVAYSSLVSTLGKVGQFEKLLEVLTMALEDGLATEKMEELKKTVTVGENTEAMVEILQKLCDEAASADPPASPFDALTPALPQGLPRLSHTTEGMTKVPLLHGQEVDLNGDGVSGAKELRTYAGWEPVTTYQRKNHTNITKVKSMYKMPPRRWHLSESQYQTDAA